jgi:hypothetical protein
MSFVAAKVPLLCVSASPTVVPLPLALASLLVVGVGASRRLPGEFCVNAPGTAAFPLVVEGEVLTATRPWSG